MTLYRDLSLNGEGALIDNPDLGLMDFEGNGSPEGVITANPGAVYRDLDGGAGVTLWVKESGSGNTGWDAK